MNRVVYLGYRGKPFKNWGDGLHNEYLLKATLTPDHIITRLIGVTTQGKELKPVFGWAGKEKPREWTVYKSPIDPDLMMDEGL